MNRRTVLALNQVNLDFYQQESGSFSQTRQRPWQGWSRVVEHLAPGAEELISVLDVGCGNGRFGAYWGRRRGGAVKYWGLDASSALLADAQRNLSGLHPELVQHDLVASLADAERPALFDRSFDCVAAFGLLHHIPGRAYRVQLLSWCAEALKPGGILALTCWRFGARERFQKKLKPWECAAPSYAIETSELEPGDCLVSWGTGGALRYCHFVSEDEMQSYQRIPGLHKIDSFLADGKTADLNTYLVFRRQS